MNKYLKYVLPLLITILLGWFLLQRGIRWNDLQSVLHRANLGALLLALICQTASFGAVTYLNQILLQGYGAAVPFRRQYGVQLAMAFVEAIVPSASISGVVLRARLLKPNGVSADVAAATTLTEGTLIVASVVLTTVLLAGLAVFYGAYDYYNLIHGLAFFVIALILTGVGIWQWNARQFSRFRAQLLQWLSRAWEQNILKRWPEQLGAWSAEWIIGRFRYLQDETVSSLRNRPYAIMISLMARYGFEALCLALCFYSLAQKLPMITLLFVYSLTITINTLGAIPGGIGLAELTLSALYSQLGITTEMAVTIALAYRLVGYWFPRIAGGLVWLWIEQLNSQQSTSEVTP